MGRTLPSITFAFYQEVARFEPFKRALARTDQSQIEELFSYARLHLAPAAYAANPFLYLMFFLAMLLEEHKRVISLQEIIEKLVSREGQDTSSQDR